MQRRFVVGATLTLPFIPWERAMAYSPAADVTRVEPVRWADPEIFAEVRRVFSDPRHMSAFDPDRPCRVYDCLNKDVFDWKPEGMAAHYREWARFETPDVVNWEGMLSGWEALG